MPDHIFRRSDSCHSESVARTMLADGTMVDPIPDEKNRLMNKCPEVYKKFKSLYDNDVSDAEKNISKTNKINATVILFSGCQDNQTSLDGDKNGLFTEKLLKVYYKGKFKGNYAGLLAGMLKLMPSNQTPDYYLVGKRNKLSKAQSSLKNSLEYKTYSDRTAKNGILTKSLCSEVK